MSRYDIVHSGIDTLISAKLPQTHGQIKCQIVVMSAVPLMSVWIQCSELIVNPKVCNFRTSRNIGAFPEHCADIVLRLFDI